MPIKQPAHGRPAPEPAPPEEPLLPEHELVRHEQALGPVQGLKPSSGVAKPGHAQRLRGAALRVQALKPLFHENRRIRAGEVFTLTDPRKFKPGQMLEVTDEVPPKDPKAFAPDPFPFPRAAAVKRGIPGMPRTAQGTRPTLDPRAGLAAPQTDDEALGADPDKLLE